jgi:hypothetical protein
MLSSSYKTLVVLSLFSSLAVSQTFGPVTLRQIVGSAGYIFSGTVTGIEFAQPTRPDEVATVRLTFRVEEGIRGVRSRQSLVIREWAGLWNAGERYRVGQRIVLALYSPSKLGLTSPVGGALGRFSLDSGGFLVVPPEQNHMLASDPAIGSWLKGKDRVSGRSFARMLRRTVKE